MNVTVGILTVSDRAATGEYEDKSGALIADIIGRKTTWEVARKDIVSDVIDEIADFLVSWCELGINLVLTTGGTGFAPRDITPEATLSVIERAVPGIPEVLRLESLKVTRHAMLSRAVAGMRGRTLIINLPGSPKAVKENMDVLLPVLPHALELLSGGTGTDSGHRSV